MHSYCVSAGFSNWASSSSWSSSLSSLSSSYLLAVLLCKPLASITAAACYAINEFWLWFFFSPDLQVSLTLSPAGRAILARIIVAPVIWGCAEFGTDMRLYPGTRSLLRQLLYTIVLIPRSHSYCLSLPLCLEWYNGSITSQVHSGVTKRVECRLVYYQPSATIE